MIFGSSWKLPSTYTIKQSGKTLKYKTVIKILKQDKLSTRAQSLVFLGIRHRWSSQAHIHLDDHAIEV